MSCYSNSTLHFSSKSTTWSAWLRLLLICSILPRSIIFIAVSNSINVNFISGSLWRANFSRTVIYDDTGWRGWYCKRGWKKRGSWIKFDKIETDMGTCFPIHSVVCVSCMSLPEHKSTRNQIFPNIWTVFAQLCMGCWFYLNFLKVSLLLCKRFLGKHV